MIIDIFTKNSHYRADDEALTVECIGPRPFSPHRADCISFGPGAFFAGRRMVVAWADGRGPFGKATMRTSIIERVERPKPAPQLDSKVAAAADRLGIPHEEAVKIVASAIQPVRAI